VKPDDDRELQRLRWQCRRGMLELDCIFEAYLEERYALAEEAERAAFRALLREQDPDLQAWLLLGDPAPMQFQSVISHLREN